MPSNVFEPLRRPDQRFDHGILVWHLAGYQAGHTEVLPEGAVGDHGAVLGREAGQQAGDGRGGGAAGEDRHQQGERHDAGHPRQHCPGLLLLRLRQVAYRRA